MKKQNFFLSFIVELIIHPLSPVTILIVGWILTLIATPNNGKNFIFVQWCLDNKNNLIVFLGVWFFLATLCTYYERKIRYLKGEKDRLEQQNKTYERNANLSASIILNKYGEFSDFQRKNIYYDIFRRFVTSNTDVIGTQIHRFETFYQGNDVIYKVNYLIGYVQESTEINGIIQEYYYIDKGIHNEIMDVVTMWKKLNNHDESLDYNEISKAKDKFADKVIKLFDNLMDKMNAIKDVKDISKNDFANYLIIVILLRMMNDASSITLNQQILNNEKIDNYLATEKRTGILGSILLKDNFSFSHNGNSLKKGRIYMSEYVNMYQEDFVVTFSIESEMTMLNEDAMLYELMRYCDELRKMLTIDAV